MGDELVVVRPALECFEVGPRLDAIVLAASSHASRRTVATRLAWIARALGFVGADDVPWHALTPAHTTWITTHAIDTTAPDTARAIVAALRAILMHGWRLGVWTHDQHARLAMLPPVRGSRRPRGRSLSAGEVERLLTATTNNAAGARDRAAIGLLVGAGLRRSEAVGAEYECLVDGGLRIIGKGSRERLVPLPAWSRECIDEWIEWRGKHAGPILHPVRRGDHIERRAMTSTALYLAMSSLTDRTDVRAWSPHDGRRTFASEMLDRSDLSTVAGLLGHASTDTMRRYDCRDDRARVAAIARFDRWISPRRT